MKWDFMKAGVVSERDLEAVTAGVLGWWKKGWKTVFVFVFLFGLFFLLGFSMFFGVFGLVFLACNCGKNLAAVAPFGSGEARQTCKIKPGWCFTLYFLVGNDYPN